MSSYMDVVVADPFMRPYWRHERALELVNSSGSKRLTRCDDTYIHQYRNFLLDLEKFKDDTRALAVKNVGLYHAYNIHSRMQTDPEVGLVIEARLLAGMSPAQIAATYKTIPETIEWYERIFFNVRDFLDHSDWIVRNVLVPAADNFAQPANADTEVAARRAQPVVLPYFDMSLKLFSYFGGPLVCDTMISGFKRRQYVKKLDDLSDYFEEQFTLQLKRRSLQAATKMEITKYNVMELFALNTKLIEIQKSDKSKDDKQTAVEKNIFAMMNDFDWRVGVDGARAFEGTALGEFDKGKAELCAEELMYLGAGIKPSLQDVNERTIYRTELASNAKS